MEEIFVFGCVCMSIDFRNKYSYNSALAVEFLRAKEVQCGFIYLYSVYSLISYYTLCSVLRNPPNCYTVDGVSVTARSPLLAMANSKILRRLEG